MSYFNKVPSENLTQTTTSKSPERRFGLDSIGPLEKDSPSHQPSSGANLKTSTSNSIFSLLGIDPNIKLLTILKPPNPASDLKVGGDSRATTPAVRQNDAEVIARLAAMSPLEYDRVRIEQAKLLGCRTAVLDEMVKTARNEPGEDSSLPFPEVEPYPDSIDPAQLLDEIVAVIRRYIVLDVQLAVAAALWVALTWFADIVSIATLAIINAPEKACAKTLLQTLLAHGLPSLICG